MNVLFEIVHPAQVHLFKNAIRELERLGHRTFVTSREKEVTTDLLDAYDVDHRPLTAAGDGPVGLMAEWARREAKVYSVARSFDPDVVVGRLHPSTVHPSRLLGCRNLAFTDTVLHSPGLRFVYHAATLPFVDDLCTPPGFDVPIDDRRHHIIGFQELAYLHPEWFTPDPDLLEAHGVDADEPYYVLRFAGWDAYHDVGSNGLSRDAKRELVSTLAERGTVYISSESPLPGEFEPYRLTVPPHCVHDLLSYADLYVGDSQTMPTEAALLGTPAIRANSMVGDDDMNNFVELQRDYSLLFSYADERRAIAKATELADRASTDEEWDRKRRSLVEDKLDVTREMLNLILERRTSPEVPTADELAVAGTATPGD